MAATKDRFDREKFRYEKRQIPPFRNERVQIEQDEIVYGHTHTHTFLTAPFSRTEFSVHPYTGFGRNSQSDDDKITEVGKREN